MQQESSLEDGFPDWSQHDFQQFVRALEANGWGNVATYLGNSNSNSSRLCRMDDYNLLAMDIQVKTQREVIWSSKRSGSNWLVCP